MVVKSSSAKLISSDSDINEVFKSMHQSTGNKKYTLVKIELLKQCKA